jgi:hypothetical protein
MADQSQCSRFNSADTKIPGVAPIFGPLVPGYLRENALNPQTAAQSESSSMPIPGVDVMKTICRATLILFALISISTQLAQAKSGTGRDFIISEVTRLGGTAEVDKEAADSPIVKIDLHGTNVSDADLVFLSSSSKKDLSHLNYLDLRLTKIGDAATVHIQNLKSLQTLNLFRTEVGDLGLARLKRLTELRTLLLGGTRVTDAGLVHLKPFRKLHKLSLFQTQVSDVGIDRLRSLESLEVLLITGSRISAAGAERLQKAMPRVRFSENT